MKVMLVDDDKEILTLLSQFLDALGSFELTTCTSGPQALDVIENSGIRFDMFLLDIQMSPMSGIDLCQQIRVLPAYRFAPIIMTTAMSEKAYIDRAFTAGATDYLIKPFDFMELKHRIGLAEKSAYQARKLSDNADSLRTMVTPREVVKNPYDLSEAVPVEDVAGVIRCYAFENYLAQMNRLQFQRTKLFTVRVTNMGAIYQNCSGREFGDIVADVAEAISNALVGTGALVSYFGGGTYAAAVDNQFWEDAGEMETRIMAEIFGLGMIYRNGDNVEVSLQVREVEKPSAFSLRGSANFVEEFVGRLRSGETAAKLRA